MTMYDLKSLNLPKLYGGVLKFFSAVTSNKLTRSLLVGSLLENGGIPKLREMKFIEEPTNFPLVIPSERAWEPLELPQHIPSLSRPSRERLPFNMIRDFTAAYLEGVVTPAQVAEEVIASIAASQQTTPPLNAFIASSAEDIRQQARDSTERLKNGQARSLLEGVPLAIK
ncbi:MAG TPA: hypothetical protein PLW25_07715, partial [Anaerolineaceae bacterium]|nr:hypothetical protein [Anaerolineaceae bacterium]